METMIEENLLVILIKIIHCLISWMINCKQHSTCLDEYDKHTFTG